MRLRITDHNSTKGCLAVNPPADLGSRRTFAEGLQAVRSAIVDYLEQLRDPDPAVLASLLPSLSELEAEVGMRRRRRRGLVWKERRLGLPHRPSPRAPGQTGRRWGPTIVVALDAGCLLSPAFDPRAGRVHLRRAGLEAFLLGAADAGAEVVLWSASQPAASAADLAAQVCVLMGG